MRVNNFLLLMALFVVPMSGCLGFGDDDTSDSDCEVHSHGSDIELHGDCSDADCPEGTHMDGTSCVSEHMDDHDDDNHTVVPNVLPTAALTVTNAAGEETQTVFVGETYTFSANGTSDSDGNVELIGLTVEDANTTRFAQLLDGDGNFLAVTLLMDTAGPVNVTLRVLDDRGEGVLLSQMVFVNMVESKTFSFDLSASPLDALEDCEPATLEGNHPTLITDNYSKSGTVTASRKAMWAEITNIVASGADVTLCTAEKGDGMGYTTSEDFVFDSTFLNFFVLSGDVMSSISFDVVIHFEPRPAA